MPRSSAGPSREILEAALQGLESQRQRLDEQIAEVRGLLGQRSGSSSSSRSASSGSASSSGTQKRGRRVLSEEARARIAAAQKKRWAAFRKAKS